ncbi:MAG: S-layer homology domain-containing protein [Bacillota bacterium]
MSNKRSGRLIAVVLAVCMVLGSGPAVLLAQASTDIQGHWAEQVISRWVDRKIVDGYPDGTFRPNAPIKRAEFAALINRTFGYATLSPAEFTDVVGNEWFANDISKAVGAGYMDGYPEGVFKPNANISRQEAAMVLARINGLEETDETFDFTDIDSIPAWSRWAVVAVARAGLMTGYPDGSFSPTANFTRAETVTVLDRLVAEVFAEEGTYGNADEQTVIEGNVVVLAENVELCNYHITGDLLIAESVGEGTVTLDRVIVDGELAVKGGGANSVVIKDSTKDKVARLTVSAISVEVVDGEAEITDDGGTLQLKANVTPTNASNKNVTWSVDDPRIATIDQTGLLTAVADGTITVMATAKDGSGKKGELVVEISGQSAVIVTSDGELATALANSTKTTIILDGDEFNGFTITRGMKIVGGTIKVESADNIPGAIPKGIYIKTNDQVEIVGVKFVDGDSEHGQRKGIVTESGYTADVTISGCTFENLPMGVYFNPGAKGSIVGNTFDGMGHAAIGIDSTADVTITGNMVADTVISLEIFGNDEIKLDEVLTTNTLPEGSQVVGGKILVPQEKTVYNKNTGEEYEDIQAAVNAADEGDTILVGPGEYSVSELLTIDKPLVLRGTSPDLPVVNFGQSYKESILVKADNVTLEHLHLVKEFKGDDGSGQNCLLSIPRGGSWTLGYQVEYDGITLKGLVFEGGRTGAYITARNLTIEDCLFKDQHSKILYFNIVAGDTNVKGNTFLGDSGHAIRFEGFSEKETPHGGNITIENNVVEGKSNFLVYNGWRYAEDADPVNIRVIGNEMRSLKGDAVVIWNYFPNLHDVIVLDNDFSGVVEGSYGVRGPDQTFITATNNYWGHESGPYNGLSNPNGEGCCVSNNVVYFPWYVNEELSELSPYPKGIINARDLSSYRSLQAAINAAQPGDTIFVSEGTYTGNLTVATENLTLKATDGAASTTIKGNITMTASSVTIEGFTIDGEVEGPAGFDPQAIFEDNVFPEGSRIIGNKIMVPAAETVYNLRTGDEYECIQSAVSEAELGDTLLVAPGDYDEILEVKNKSLTIVGLDKENTKVKAISAYPGSSNDLVIKNLTVYGNNGSGQSYAGVYIANGNVTIDGCNIHGTDRSYHGIMTETGNTGNVIIQNCDLLGYKWPYFNPSQGSIMLEGNDFHGSGPSIDGFTNVTVTGNRNMSIGLAIGYGLLNKEHGEVLDGLSSELKAFAVMLHSENTDVVVKLSTNDTDTGAWGGYYTGLDEEGNLTITEQYLSK